MTDDSYITPRTVKCFRCQRNIHAGEKAVTLEIVFGYRTVHPNCDEAKAKHKGLPVREVVVH